MRKICFIAVITTSAILTSCTKDEPEIPTYEVPSIYEFNNTEYKESAALISMWAGFTGHLGKSNTRRLNQDTINYLWNNTNSAFTAETAGNVPYNFTALNVLSIKLSENVAEANLFKQLADSMVYVSQYQNVSASKGVAGKIGSRIFNHKGLEFNQAVAKGLMGALQMRNIIDILEKIHSVDNAQIIEGSGTAMQHQWDIAFGYAGIPKDYDTTKVYNSSIIDRPFGIGGYFAERGKYIQAGGHIFEAFRKGRAAIIAKDYAVRDEAISTIKLYLEKTIAAAAYYYVTAAQSQTDLAAKFHSLSEGYGFILALKYRSSNSPLNQSKYNELHAAINTDFYDIASDAAHTNLKEIQAILSGAYGQLQP